jgi:hypothetical protein
LEKKDIVENDAEDVVQVVDFEKEGYSEKMMLWRILRCRSILGRRKSNSTAYGILRRWSTLILFALQ